ncbi:alpha/beta hydrolase [candidate division KSB1 bacterium]|nr:alpha/beta hydrolase [candidate division KSB1 bacterium]
MYKRFLVTGFIILLLSVGCELDGFLFNSTKIDAYILPGNTIPDSLIEQVTFQSEGNTLLGYWVKSGRTRDGITLLYCHGNKNSMDEYWDRVMFLHELEINLLIFDYQGYGMSEGESSEAGLHADGNAALNYLRSRNDVQEDSICFYGNSLGNVVSIYLAAEQMDPLCLIAECPFASANSLTQGSTILDIPPLWLTEGEFNNANLIKRINTPLLLLHGEEDDFVRYRDNGKVVYENAPDPKSLILVPGAGHTDIPQTMGLETYRMAIQNWILSSRNISH